MPYQLIFFPTKQTTNFENLLIWSSVVRQLISILILHAFGVVGVFIIVFTSIFAWKGIFGWVCFCIMYSTLKLKTKYIITKMWFIQSWFITENIKLFWITAEIYGKGPTGLRTKIYFCSNHNHGQSKINYCKVQHNKNKVLISKKKVS